MRYLRRTPNYLERITLYDLTHMMSMANPVAISVETLKIDSGCSLEKEFTELRTKLSIKLIHVSVVYRSIDLRNQRHLVDG